MPSLEHTMAAGDMRLPGEGLLIKDKLYSGVMLTLENCLLPAEQLSQTPSAEHGLSGETEEQLRISGCERIQAAGILLRLPQVAMATGQILFQRFYYCKSFVRHCAETVAMACVHLASKIEEEPRRVRDVLNVFHFLKESRGGKGYYPMPLDGSYINMKSQVIKAERRLLKELGFCVHVKHPHKIIVMYLQVLECEKNSELVQMAWNYMNDSLRTDVFLRFRAETVACACIYLSTRCLQIPLPDEPPWFLLFGAREEDLRDICGRILHLYTLPSVPLSTLLKQVEETRQALDALSSKGKPSMAMSAAATPNLEPFSSFSPASKAASPADGRPNHETSLNQVALKNACRKLANGDEQERLSRSEERRETKSTSPPRRRRSRSVASPHHSLSPERHKKVSHRERDGEKDRWRDRDRDKDRSREKSREREREKDRERDRQRNHRRERERGEREGPRKEVRSSHRR
ncbi:cyclin-L2-like [Alosa alosa]|uniref:cyclin-L2-like n=1 Tax=Alosa alosa TaxID=278164 RepID=UPI0020154F39|nr:cyclin-L2-like [Alosa alosa]